MPKKKAQAGTKATPTAIMEKWIRAGKPAHRHLYIKAKGIEFCAKCGRVKGF